MGALKRQATLPSPPRIILSCSSVIVTKKTPADSYASLSFVDHPRGLFSYVVPCFDSSGSQGWVKRAAFTLRWQQYFITFLMRPSINTLLNCYSDAHGVLVTVLQPMPAWGSGMNWGGRAPVCEYGHNPNRQSSSQLRADSYIYTYCITVIAGMFALSWDCVLSLPGVSIAFLNLRNADLSSDNSGSFSAGLRCMALQCSD